MLPSGELLFVAGGNVVHIFHIELNSNSSTRGPTAEGSLPMGHPTCRHHSSLDMQGRARLDHANLRNILGPDSVCCCCTDARGTTMQVCKLGALCMPCVDEVKRLQVDRMGLRIIAITQQASVFVWELQTDLLLQHLVHGAAPLHVCPSSAWPIDFHSTYLQAVLILFKYWHECAFVTLPMDPVE
jgi:hypothetical protein